MQTCYVSYKVTSTKTRFTLFESIDTACAFHYQKNVGLFAIEFGLFTTPNNSSGRALLDMAMGLCYLPEQNIAPAIAFIEESITSVSKDFGEALVKYLRREWLPKNIR